MSSPSTSRKRCLVCVACPAVPVLMRVLLSGACGGSLWSASVSASRAQGDRRTPDGHVDGGKRELAAGNLTQRVRVVQAVRPRQLENRHEALRGLPDDRRDLKDLLYAAHCLR